jgi:hypothetical protein
VFPAWKAIVVTTGGGFTWNDIASLIGSAVVDMNNPIPANPAGRERLNDAVAAVGEPPAPLPVEPLSDIARLVSGRTFVLQNNPLNLETLLLKFDGSAEAGLHLTFVDQPDRDFLVGLDGIYRRSAVEDYGLEMGLRGRWRDGRTFQLEYDRIANRDAYMLQMDFTGDRVTIEVRERTREDPVVIAGRMRPEP